MMTQMTSLHEERLDSVVSELKSTGARTVLDLGCGSGSLLHRLVAETQFSRVVGLEQCGMSLAQSRRMLADHLGADEPRLQLLRGSYAESNPHLHDFEAAAMVETIEHVHPNTLSNVEAVVFGQYRPRVLFMTTPNREFNPLLGLGADEFREPDHKFEWSRMKFQRWARGVAERNGYRVRFGGIGEFHPDFGQPTQTALFSRTDCRTD